MRRSEFMKKCGAGLGAISMAGLGGKANGASAKPPNVVVILTDDQTYGALAALGNPDIITPNMDRLVGEGVAFTKATIVGSPSGAVCGPSRAMLMTGRPYFHLPNTITTEWSAPDDVAGDCPYITFPEVFRKKGYTTFATGKQHNGTKIVARGFTHGGALFFGGMHSPSKGGHLKPTINDFEPSGVYPEPHVVEKFSTELFTDAAVDFLKTYRDDAPYMMYVAYTAPHDPRMAPQRVCDLYDAKKLTLPENFMPGHSFDNGALKIRDEKTCPFPRTPENVRETLAAYYAMVTHADEQIGRIIAAIEKRGEWDNTIVVFAGDNGLAVGQHGLMGKQNLYQHSVGVPLVFRGPGVAKGKKSDALCYLHDVFPTLCEMTDTPIPDSVESQSLLPILKDATKPSRESLFHSYTKTQRAIRHGRWKLICYNVKDTRTTQLFDLDADPYETRDLAKAPEHKRLVKQLTEELKAAMTDIGDGETIEKGFFEG